MTQPLPENALSTLPVGGALPVNVTDSLPGSGTRRPPATLAALLAAGVPPSRLTDALPGQSNVVLPDNTIDALPVADPFALQNLLLILDINAGAWAGTNGAVFPNIYTNATTTPPGGDADWIGVTDDQAAAVYSGKFANASDPGVLGPFTLFVRGRNTSPDDNFNMDLSITDATNHTLWSGSHAWPRTDFATLTFTVTFSQAPSSWIGLRFNITNSGGPSHHNGGLEWNWAELVLPAPS